MTKRCLHFLVWRSPHGDVLARRTDAGWLLPFVTTHDGERVGTRLEYINETCGIDGILVHEARVSSAERERHSYCAISARERHGTAGGYTWVRADDLLSDRHVLDEQRMALRQFLDRNLSKAAPFDSVEQIEAAHAWALVQLRREDMTPSRPPRPYRSMRYDTVIEFSCLGGTRYFKGGPDRLADEAAWTEALHAIQPNAFPYTVAKDQTAMWWLTSGLPGTPIWQRGVDLATMSRVAIAAASVQKAFFRSPPNCAFARRLTIDEMCRRSLARADRLAASRPAYRALAEEVAGKIHELRKRVSNVPLPMTWVHTDFSPTNILIDGEHDVRFIDLEYGYIAPAPLILWSLFNSRSGATLSKELREIAVQAYMTEWSDTVAPSVMRMGINALSVAGALLGLEAHEQRLLRHLRDEEDVMPDGQLLTRGMLNILHGIVAA